MDETTLEKARLYALRYQVRIGRPLGSGHHGNVFAAERDTTPSRFAVKFNKSEGPYFRELRAYQILKAHDITEIESFSVPQLLGNDDEFLAIEMSIVEPPF